MVVCSLFFVPLFFVKTRRYGRETHVLCLWLLLASLHRCSSSLTRASLSMAEYRDAPTIGSMEETPMPYPLFTGQILRGALSLSGFTSPGSHLDQPCHGRQTKSQMLEPHQQQKNLGMPPRLRTTTTYLEADRHHHQSKGLDDIALEQLADFRAAASAASSSTAAAPTTAATSSARRIGPACGAQGKARIHIPLVLLVALALLHTTPS